ncbi:hypothetical protein CLFO_19560 [Clostridium formicaceticum]|uniref:Uncharacterized protein n=1 Tax=Clostridium formicaceticum TaxID=1497 RepID=A0AAC9WG80_9CLOT|nr:hypothetical protein BJL90_15060 [Clostridium formicaceticum]ARE87556.1 hypothetical protein CLFO_19560 [Clostridium formicaceticum]
MIEVLIAIILSAVMVVSTASILGAINRIYKRSVLHYEISKIAQAVMEELYFTDALREEGFDTAEYTLEITKEKIQEEKEGYRVRVKLRHRSKTIDYILYSYTRDQVFIPQEAYREMPIEPWELLD